MLLTPELKNRLLPLIVAAGTLMVALVARGPAYLALPRLKWGLGSLLGLSLLARGALKPIFFTQGSALEGHLEQVGNKHLLFYSAGQGLALPGRRLDPQSSQLFFPSILGAGLALYLA